MSERIPLTRVMAEGLLKARKAAGLSQYTLAEKLGWVRSKIKRLELGEVESILKKDYKTLMDLLEGRAPSNGVKPRKKAAASRKKAVQASRLFDIVDPIKNRRSRLRFFRVRLAREMSVDDLISQTVALKDVRGTINGVEHTQSQGPKFRKGEKVVIAVFPS
jgi:transcriptional regulator with XRE-family HTH domain